MQQLNLPEYKFRTRDNAQGKQEIFDEVRKCFVALTPEEWVRQNLIQFLSSQRGFPLSLMAIEKGIVINGKEYRADIVLYNDGGKPIMIVECKAPEVKLTQEVFQQAARYNLHYKVSHLMISNGLQHYCALIDFKQNATQILSNVPYFKELKACR